MVLGSLVPLLLAIGWSVAASSLAAAAAAAAPAAGAGTPVLTLVRASPALAAPTVLIAVGAIGSTMIAALLACSQLLADVWPGAAAAPGGAASSARDMYAKRRAASRAAVVVIPAALACLGPRIYLPLLAFSGAFPTIVLYGLLPPLAALAMRARAAAGLMADCATGATVEAPAIVPGGKAALLAVALLACSLLGINAVLLFVR